MGRPARTKESVDSDIIEQLKTCYMIYEKGCWIWQGLMFGNGYGRLARHLNISAFSCRAHIAAYQMYVGPVSEGLLVCHHCDVKRCINPEHLWLGTNQDNQIDAAIKGKFETYWTAERRKAQSARYSG